MVRSEPFYLVVSAEGGGGWGLDGHVRARKSTTYIVMNFYGSVVVGALTK
jgi:hypothetical protein